MSVTKQQAVEYINQLAEELASSLGGTKEEHMDFAKKHFEAMCKRNGYIVVAL